MSDLSSLAEQRRQYSIYLIIICLVLTFKAGIGFVVTNGAEQDGTDHKTTQLRQTEKTDQRDRVIQSVRFNRIDRDTDTGIDMKEKEPEPDLRRLRAREKPQWRRNAVNTQNKSDKPSIAIVIDDIGLRKANSRAVMQLKAPLTLALLPYADKLEQQAKMARRSGHELLVHMPMQPRSTTIDPGPNALQTNLKHEQLQTRISIMLSAFDDFVGINNHMGSRFTADKQGMSRLMQVLRDRGLLYLDSLTTPDSVGAKMAARHNVPFAARNVFIDHVAKPGHIHDALEDVERIAREEGYAIAIGHPKDATITALKTWMPKARDKGFQFVPISAVVQQLHKTAHMHKKQVMRDERNLH